VLFPPDTPLTLQLTVVSVVLLTLAVKVAEFPNNTELLVVVTATIMGGGGGGPPKLAPPPHPSAHTSVRSRANRPILLDSRHDPDLRERGRMLCPRQAKGQRR